MLPMEIPKQDAPNNLKELHNYMLQPKEILYFIEIVSYRTFFTGSTIHLNDSVFFGK